MLFTGMRFTPRPVKVMGKYSKQLWFSVVFNDLALRAAVVQNFGVR